MIEKLKSINRALLELWLGILFTGLVFQLVGMWFAADRWLYSVALWLGVILALITILHMYRTLDRVLDQGANAQKTATIANIVRYAMIIVVFVIVMLTGILNPLITFLGLMSVKVAAYIQPFTHKLCNKIFHETDPIPEAMPEDEGKYDMEEKEL